MDRRLLIFIGLLLLLVIGGGLTSAITSDGAASLVPGVLTQTERAEGSVTQFGGSQGLWLFLVIGAVVFNLVGAAATGAFIFWFLSREVTRAKAEEPAQHDRIQDAFQLPRRGGKQDDEENRELPSGA